MTTYGTIPSSSASHPKHNLDYSRAQQTLSAHLSTRRPWRQMFSFHSLSLPHSLHESTSRVKTNLSYFSVNYAMIVLGIVFLSLLWHPVSLIVFIVMMALWVYFYFFRDENQPVVVFGKVIGDRIVLGVLAVLTVGVLLFTNAVLNVIVSVIVGVVVVVVHAAVRGTEDLEFDEEASEGFVR